MEKPDDPKMSLSLTMVVKKRLKISVNLIVFKGA